MIPDAERNGGSEIPTLCYPICQDIFPTEATRFAHVILPVAARSENGGIFTSAERCVNRVRTAGQIPQGLVWMAFHFRKTCTVRIDKLS
jgi:hypothetical protein